MATKTEYARKMPGRIIGVTRDSRGKPALRLTMQTREQHIKRDKATSNICTAQALLANMASAYGVYHGPEGIKAIAQRIHNMTVATAKVLKDAGYSLGSDVYFDTLRVHVQDGTSETFAAKAEFHGVNVRVIDSSSIGISFGEAIVRADVEALLQAFDVDPAALSGALVPSVLPASLKRTSAFMTHPVFNCHHSETEMLRYLHSLEVKDIALNFSMIALGSCTMKLNATSEMMPVTWPEVNAIHPFAPRSQTIGYGEMIASLHKDLAALTGFAAVSSQPNSGAQGEYSGLLCIRHYHDSRGDTHRNICIIPVSAHGTNPASAVVAGMQVVTVKTDKKGSIDLVDYKAKVEKHSKNLAAIMITYPSTFGVFDEEVKTIIDICHQHGGQVCIQAVPLRSLAQVVWIPISYLVLCVLGIHGRSQYECPAVLDFSWSHRC